MCSKKSGPHQWQLDPPQEQNASCPMKVARLDKFSVVKLILNGSIKEEDHIYNVAEARSISGNEDLARFLATQNRRSLDELFECAKQLAKTLSKKIEPPCFESIRKIAADNCVEGCNCQCIK